MPKDLRCLELAELQKLAIVHQEKKFAGTILFEWLHKKSVADLDAMSNLSKTFREALKKDGYEISELKLLKRTEDSDSTQKYLFQLSDGQKIETVLLDDDGRKTLCVSTQVGCKMACVFCATGKMHFKRNLSAGEIISQLMQVEKNEKLKVQNIVYMGMGEPLDNYNNVLKSIRILNTPNGRNIGARHITISTCGLVAGIERLAKENLQIRLAISLHGATDAVRGQLMPINKKYPVAQLIRAVKTYQRQTGRRVTFEYIMLAGINDTREHARSLLKLLNGISAQINLIEYNPHSRSEFMPSAKKTIREFWWVTSDRGFATSMRFKRGQSINAACGQLYSENI